MEEARSRIYVTTDKEKGALKQFITNKDNRWNKTNIVPVSNKYYNLTIPQFSIVTLVGKVHL